MPVTIRVQREQMFNGYQALRSFSWSYRYTTPLDITLLDGSPGPRAGEFVPYGTGLASLRDMLRLKYGTDALIIETWKAA